MSSCSGPRPAPGSALSLSILGWKPPRPHEGWVSLGEQTSQLLWTHSGSRDNLPPGAQLSALHTGRRHQLAKCLPRLLPPPHPLPRDQLLEAIHRFPTPGLPENTASSSYKASSTLSKPEQESKL